MKKILSLLLVLVMILGMIPATALTANAAGPTVTWTNESFSTQQNLEDGTVLELVGDNVITIDGAVKPNHNNDFFGIYGIKNLTIQGSGTLTINMKPTDVVSGYDIDRLELDGINASHLTIKGNVTIVINIEGAFHGIGGIVASTVSVEDAANLDITVKNTKEHASCVGISADTWASLTSTETTNVNVSVNTTTSYKLGDGILVSGMNIKDANNGDLTIKNGTVNVSFDNNARGYGFFGAAIIASTYATDGSLLIENATVNTTANSDGKQYVAIQESSNTKSADPTLIVRNSTLNLSGRGLNGGLASWYNGMHLDNSNVTVNGDGHTLQARFLKISGGEEVSLKTSCENPVWVPPTKGYIEFALTPGGKFTAESTTTSTYDMNYVKLGTDNYVTSGSVDYSNNYNGDTSIGFATAANKKFVVEYQDHTIDYVDIVDIDLPEAGARPDMEYDIISANLDEKKTKIEWFECDKNGRYDSTKPLSATDLYKEDTYYRVNVTVYPREGYVFDSRNLSAYINDPAVNYYYNNDDSVTIYAVYNVHEVDTKNTIDVFLNSKDFVTIKDGDYLAQSSDTPTTAKPTNNYIYYKDGVLYLNNYERNVHLRFSEKHLEVRFSGDNAICGLESNYNDYDYTAIAFYGGADDHLDLDGLGRSSCTITAYAAFFNGGNYTVSDGSYVAFWWTDYVEVNGGADIWLPLSQYGPFSEADVTLCVNEGEIEFSDGGTWQSDWLLTDLTITGGTAYVRGSHKDEYAKWDKVSDFNDYDYLLVKNPKPVQTATVSGTVSGVEGGTAVWVYLCEQGENISSYEAKADANGKYVITGIAPGSYTLKVQAEGYNEYSKNITVSTDTTCNVTMTKKPTPPAGDHVMGDVNGDGAVNSMDSYTLKLILAGVNVPTEDEKTRADVNGDGAINSMDSYTLKLILAGVYK